MPIYGKTDIFKLSKQIKINVVGHVWSPEYSHFSKNFQVGYICILH